MRELNTAVSRPASDAERAHSGYTNWGHLSLNVAYIQVRRMLLLLKIEDCWQTEFFVLKVQSMLVVLEKKVQKIEEKGEG